MSAYGLYVSGMELLLSLVLCSRIALLFWKLLASLKSRAAPLTSDNDDAFCLISSAEQHHEPLLSPKLMSHISTSLSLRMKLLCYKIIVHHSLNELVFSIGPHQVLDDTFYLWAYTSVSQRPEGHSYPLLKTTL